MRTHGK